MVSEGQWSGGRNLPSPSSVFEPKKSRIDPILDIGSCWEPCLYLNKWRFTRSGQTEMFFICILILIPWTLSWPRPIWILALRYWSPSELFRRNSHSGKGYIFSNKHVKPWADAYGIALIIRGNLFVYSILAQSCIDMVNEIPLKVSLRGLPMLQVSRLAMIMTPHKAEEVVFCWC